MSDCLIHVITTIEYGGAEKQLLLLATIQAETGYNVSVVCLKGNLDLAKELSAGGVKVIDFTKRNIFGQIRTLRKLSCGKILVHAHLPRAELVSRLALIGRDNPLLISRHNSEPFWPSAPRSLSRILSRFVCRRADSIIAISSEVKNFMNSEGELSKKTISKVKVVPYGAAPPDVLNQIKERKDVFQFRIGVAARLEPQKDLKTLLDALVIVLHQSRDNWSLKIAGVGSLELDLKRYAIELGIEKNILWLGKVRNIAEFYESIDLFVLPSKYEGFGMVLLESMQYGIPIISSNIPTSREIFGVGYPGFFETGNPRQLADQLLKARKVEIREAYLRGYNENLEKFSKDAMFSRMQEIYQSID
jgi:glycosyltransferase involved in cell wall biosynthesis